MNNKATQSISDFLSDTEPFVEQLDALSFDAAAELYDLLDEAAHSATEYINEIDPELRVQLCDRQDRVLERIVDVLPPFENTGEQIMIYSPALGSALKPWYNFHLMKDCGISGYLLAEQIGAKSIMFFGDDTEEYSYLSLLPGLELQYRCLDDNAETLYKQHLLDNYREMDVLILYGMYAESLGYVNAYRKVRPDGKIYCAFDMNTYWMNTINWQSDDVVQFQRQCDIIATSCREMRDILNRTPYIHFPCRWLPNGFYNPEGMKLTADAEYKENVILTAGRIGNGQKNNEELMIAFARAADTLGGWTLRLVGRNSSNLQAFLDWYFAEYPEMKERVILTGNIIDKAMLYDEYAKAKIFALSSRTESGTPNVYAEALYHGCMFVTSDIDGADDITNFGELGEKYTRGDIDGLSNALIKVCSAADKKAFEKHIPKALAYANKYYDWNRNAKKLAYMLFR